MEDDIWQALIHRRGRGRPKLGVVSHVVTLSAAQWKWLKEQPGGASAVLRRLVDEAKGATPRAVAPGSAGQLDKAAPSPAPAPAPAAPSPAAPAAPAQPSPLDCLLDPQQRDAALRVIASAFGSVPLESAERLTIDRAPPGSGAVLRISVGSKPYVLRFADGVRHHECLTIASAAGVAPRVICAEERLGVVLQDDVSVCDEVPPLQQRFAALLSVVKALHAAPSFPPGMHYLDLVGGMVQEVAALRMLTPAVWSRQFGKYWELRAAYPNSACDVVPSHNGICNAALLWSTGTDGPRVFLVDWELACAADRYVDLAGVSLLFAEHPDNDHVLLSEYFGKTAHVCLRWRLWLMRQAVRVMRATVLLKALAAVRPELRLSETALTEARSSVRRELMMRDLVPDELPHSEEWTAARLLREVLPLLHDIRVHFDSGDFANATLFAGMAVD